MRIKKSLFYLFSFPVAYVVLSGFSEYVSAQPIPDRTLRGESTRLRSTGQNDFVEGGALRGDTLFHSFEELSIGARRVLLFESEGVDHIFTRVTGNQRSRINGVLGTTGQSDLYLINPNGITFGPNSRLDIGGSFVASTSDAFMFPSFEFGADQPGVVPPLLTIRDWGLQVRPASGPIRIRGNGHSVTTTYNGSFGPVDFIPYQGVGGTEDGLSVPSSESLAFIANGISLTGGVLSAPSGHIYLASGGDTDFQFNSSRDGFRVDRLGGSSAFIRLREDSLLDTSGVGGSGIDIFSDQLLVTERSLIIDQNQGLQPGNGISIDTRTLYIEGFDVTSGDGVNLPLGQTSGISSYTFEAEGSDINIDADRLILRNGGFVNTRTFGSGIGGSINVDSDDISVTGFIENPGTPSMIQAATHASGKGGSIGINSRSIYLNDNGIIAANSLSFDPTLSNDAGNINIEADVIRLNGGLRNGARRFSNTTLISAAVGEGNTGNIGIQANDVYISEGATLATFLVGDGAVGSINLVSDNLTIQGLARGINFRVPRDIDFGDFGELETFTFSPRSAILSTRLIGTVKESIDVELIEGSGAAGGINIQVDRLELLDGGFISFLNTSSLSAQDLSQSFSGLLEINAGDILLDEAGITSDTIIGGIGGQIEISSNSIQLINGSIISASASGFSNGGLLNLNMDDDFFLIDSDIRANGEFGFGGFIDIRSRGFYDVRANVEASSGLSSAFDGEIKFTVRDYPLLDLSTWTDAVILDEVEFSPSCFRAGDQDIFLSLNLRRTGEASDQFVPYSLWVPSTSSPNALKQESQSVPHLEALSIYRDDSGAISLVGAETYASAGNC